MSSPINSNISERVCASNGGTSPSFDEFWSAYPHRPRCRPKAEARELFFGKRPLIDGSRIKPSQWPEIIRGAMAYREVAGADDYRINAARFLRTMGWEGAIEELGEMQAATAESFDRSDFHRWKEHEHANGRLGTKDEYEAQRFKARGNVVRMR